MQGGEELILQYFNFNGKEIPVEQLKVYRAGVQNYLDAIGHGPHVPRLKVILSRITKAIDYCIKNDFTDVQVIIEPIPSNEISATKVIEKMMKAVPDDIKESVRQQVEKISKTVKEQTPRQIEKIARLIKERREKKKVENPAPASAVEGIKKTRVRKGSAENRSPGKPKGRKAIGDLPKVKPRQEAEPTPPPAAEPVADNISGISYQFKPVNLGPYEKDFHRMNSDTIVQIHGMPGHGKTTYLLKHAQYRAEQGEHVLYVPREEFGRSDLEEKLKENNIGHANLRFRRDLSKKEDLEWANVVFLDSASALKIDHEAMEELVFQYPNRNWFVILQSTKDGDFRGSNEWEHLVTIAGEIRHRKLIINKNRLDQNNAQKREELLKESAIIEAKKKVEIKEAVKQSMEKPVPVPAPSVDQNKAA